jgi:NADH dehydrogenase
VWLIGFRNRIVVLVDWAWAYLTFHGNDRVILTAPDVPTPPAASAPPREAALRG